MTGKPDALIGAKVVEVSGHSSKEIDWQQVAAWKAEHPGETLNHSQYPTKDVMHYGSITLELSDGTQVEMEANSYYDSYWIEAR